MPLPAPEPAQALLVLGGEDPLHRPRSRAALHYYLASCARGQEPPYLVLSGAGSAGARGFAQASASAQVQHKPATEAVAMADYLLARGVARDHLMQEPLARSTLANVVLGGALAARHGLQRVALVSDDFHLWRARHLYQRVWGRTPVACIASGIYGSSYLRLREKVAFALQTSALRLAGATPGDWRAHWAFVQDCKI